MKEGNSDRTIEVQIFVQKSRNLGAAAVVEETVKQPVEKLLSPSSPIDLVAIRIWDRLRVSRDRSEENGEKAVIAEIETRTYKE